MIILIILRILSIPFLRSLTEKLFIQFLKLLLLFVGTLKSNKNKIQNGSVCLLKRKKPEPMENILQSIS